MTTALFPTISNPPSFGTILALKYIENLYDKIFVVVRETPKLLSVDKVCIMLDKVLAQGNLKYSIIRSPIDFEHITVLPKTLPHFDMLITEDIKIYCNLAAKGYDNIFLIPKPVGWDETLHRIAFQRSMVLEKVANSIKTISNPDEYVDKIKKENEV